MISSKGSFSASGNTVEGSATDMGCGSSTPVVVSTATTPRELSVRSGTASLSSPEGTYARRLVFEPGLSQRARSSSSESQQVATNGSNRYGGRGVERGPMGRSRPPFQRLFSVHPKYDVLLVLGAASLAIFPSARTRRPRGSTDNRRLCDSNFWPPPISCPQTRILRCGS